MGVRNAGYDLRLAHARRAPKHDGRVGKLRCAGEFAVEYADEVRRAHGVE
jgi:hypothetical protein